MLTNKSLNIKKETFLHKNQRCRKIDVFYIKHEINNWGILKIYYIKQKLTQIVELLPELAYFKECTNYSFTQKEGGLYSNERSVSRDFTVSYLKKF